MLHPLVTFCACAPLFLALCALLTRPSASLPSSVRISIGTLVVFVVVLGAIWYSPSPWTLLAGVSAAAFGSAGMRGAGLRELGEAMGRMRFPAYLLAVATLSALVFLYVPITTFLTAPGDLGVNLGFLLTVNARDAMTTVYVAALIYALAFTPRMRTTLAFVALTMLMIALVYAYLLPFGYPMMTGLAFENVMTEAPALYLRLAADFAVVASLVLALRALLIRFGGKPLLVGMVLINASLCVAAGIGIYQDSTRGGTENDGQFAEQPLQFSKAKPNVLIIFLDRFMGSYVESILKSDPHLADVLSGFVWYPRTVSAGENSIAGVHPMLGGYDYLPVEMNARHQLLRDLSVEAFSILPYNFSRRGYHVNMVSPKGLGFIASGDCNYLKMPGVTCTHIPLTVARRQAQKMGFPLKELARSNYADLLVLLGGMRSAPYAAKEVLLRRGPWRAFLDHSAATTFREWAELRAFAEMSQFTAKESNLNFISNILAHEPYYLGENCLPIREPLKLTPEELGRRGHPSLFSLQHAIAARCALLMVGEYLQVLKKSGVYDNTKIVIVSDHGIVGAVDDHSSRAVAGGTEGPEYVRTRSVLLVKDRDAAGPLRISESFKPNAEVPHIVCEEIGGCVNPYLGNRPIAARGRDDPFYVSLVPWQFSLQAPQAFVIGAQFSLTGKDPYDARGWKKIDADTLE